MHILIDRNGFSLNFLSFNSNQWSFGLFKRSPNASYLALSSQDGYCTLVEFEDKELGEAVSISGLLLVLSLLNLPEPDWPINPTTVGKKPVDGEEKKHDLEKGDELMTETTPDESKKQAELEQNEESKQPLPSKITTDGKEKEHIMQKTDDEVMTETRHEEENQPLQSKVNTPVSNKPARKRITPMAIDPWCRHFPSVFFF